MRALQAGVALLIFVMGSVQAWDSKVPAAGVWTVLLVSLSIALPPVALLSTLEPVYLLSAYGLSFVLLIIARLTSPTPLPGLFLVFIPAVIGFLFSSVLFR
jgi:hypothetical protein